MKRFKLILWTAIPLSVLAVAAYLSFASTDPPSVLSILREAKIVQTKRGRDTSDGTRKEYIATVYELQGNWEALEAKVRQELMGQGWNRSGTGPGPAPPGTLYRYQEFRNHDSGCEIVAGRIGRIDIGDRRVYWSPGSSPSSRSYVVSVIVTRPANPSGWFDFLRHSLGL